MTRRTARGPISPTATTDLPASDPDRAGLPTVAFLIPNLCHDTHDCDVAAGDEGARRTLGGHFAWAAGHDALLVLTVDESEDRSDDAPLRHRARRADGDAG